MSYRTRVFLALSLFFGAVIAANVMLVQVSRSWASDALEVGPGHSKFPPQAERKGIAP